MTGLQELIPHPRLTEVDTVELAIPLDQAWHVIRHASLGRLPLVRALFSLRTGKAPDLDFDHFVSTPQRPGFQVLVDRPLRELAVGAIGKVWKLDLPFLHVPDAAAFTAFGSAGWVKVAWALQLHELSDASTRVRLELRVDATDEQSWRKFSRYFRVVGPPSRFIRRSTLSALAREHGTPASKQNERPLRGDALLPDASMQVTHSILIDAPPEAVWPWLVQMGCQRAGFYSIDALDNAGTRSAREIHPELQDLRVGDVVPATPSGHDGFEVLSVAPNRALVLGGLFDTIQRRQRRFGARRPDDFWHMTWAFVLEPVDAQTRLFARARAAFPPGGRPHALWMGAIHRLMQTAQLKNLAVRAEGRLPRDDWRDVAQGLFGAAVIATALATPMLRRARDHWGLDAADSARQLPGDELVSNPSWGWTHGIEIDARPQSVWPWIAQLGADRGGFYSYQWLENVAGCALRNAETVRPEWELEEGDGLLLHPRLAPLRVVRVSRGRYFVASAAAGEAARASWLFYLEPVGVDRSRLISRYRCAHSGELATRLQFGAALLEPIGFAMDRQLLRGVKQRAERMSLGLRALLGESASPPADEQPGAH